jgi:hypothetical protein
MEEERSRFSSSLVASFTCCFCGNWRGYDDDGVVTEDKVLRMNVQGDKAVYYICSELCAVGVLEVEDDIACIYTRAGGHPSEWHPDRPSRVLPSAHAKQTIR